MKNEIRKYLAKIGSRGGKAGKGASKARSTILARKAAYARWKNGVLHNNVQPSTSSERALRFSSASDEILQLQVRPGKTNRKISKQIRKSKRKLERWNNK